MAPGAAAAAALSLAMGFSLIANVEHYFFDGLLGWIYAGTIMATWAWWERRRERAPRAVPYPGPRGIRNGATGVKP